MPMRFPWTTWAAFSGSLAGPARSFRSSWTSRSSRLEVFGPDHPVPGKIARLGCGRNGRLAVVDGCEQRVIRTCCLHVLRLRGGRRNVLLTCYGLFLRGRSRGSPARAAIEADVSYSHIVDDGFVVDVGDVHTTEIVHGRVVAEDAASPVAALVAGAHIAETVIDAAVVSNMRPPIATVVDVRVLMPAPIARGPEQTDGRRLHPGSRHPVIALETISPKAGRPDVAGAGNFRLIIERQLRRRDGHGDVYDLRR
jgi:hypothetical protein